MQWTVGTCSHVTKKQGLNKTSLLTSVNIAGKYCTTCCLAEEFQIYTDTKLIHFHSKKNSRDRSALPLKWTYLIPNIIQTHLKEEQGRKTRRSSKNAIRKQCHQYTLFSATDFQSATMKLFFKLNILNDVIWQGHKVGIGKKIIKTWGKTSDTAEIMNRDSFNTWLTCLWGSL